MKTRLFLVLLTCVVARTEVSQVSLRQTGNVVVPDLRFVCFDYNVTGVSEKCDEQLDIVCQNDTLLYTILDASAKFPYPGLLYASRRDYGNFDQCMTVDHKYEGGRILGEYCAGGLVIPDVSGNLSQDDSFHLLAVCRPNECTADDLNIILSNIDENFSEAVFQDLICQTIETGMELTATDIVTITIFSVCGLLMIVSSVYDFYLIKKQLKCPNPLYIAFSVITNGKKLLHVAKNSKEQISTFHGLRTISIMWIIAGHGFSLWSRVAVSNEPILEEWRYKTYAGYITTSRLAVDTFFYLSGFLCSYQYLKQKPKPLRAHIRAVPQQYLHRYLRLTPAVLMLYLVCISVISHMGSGPMWHWAMETMTEPCRKYWWAFFLYIQNYYNYTDDDICLVHTWYLSADMQMFLLAPLVIIPISLFLTKSSGFKSTMILMLALNVFWTFLPMVIKLVFQDYENMYDTHSRLVNYFIGMMLGVFMRVRQDKPFLYMIKSQHLDFINLLTWIVILLGMLAVVVNHHEVEYKHGYTSQSVFESLMRPAWCIGLSWIVYSCYHGYGGFANWILCRPIFQIWGRLTYCMYLLHILVEVYYIASIRTRVYFSDYNVFYLFCGHYIVTAILSVFWTLAFESPLIVIEKLLFGKGNKKKEAEPKQNNGASNGTYRKNDEII